MESDTIFRNMDIIILLIPPFTISINIWLHALNIKKSTCSNVTLLLLKLQIFNRTFIFLFYLFWTLKLYHITCPFVFESILKNKSYSFVFVRIAQSKFPDSNRLSNIILLFDFRLIPLKGSLYSGSNYE